MRGQPIAGAPHAAIDGKSKRAPTRYERSAILRRRRTAIAERPEPRSIRVVGSGTAAGPAPPSLGASPGVSRVSSVEDPSP